MKNLHAVVGRRDIHEYVANLFRTEIFREDYRSGGFIFKLVDQFAWLPRFFADETNDHLERAHFSTWWNVIMRRDDYANPYIHDLYYLHEIAHAATMPYIAGIGRSAWEDKMQRNELEASVLSEIQVYFEIPGLREKSFDHEIYADRFLNLTSMLALFKANRTVAIETMRSMRKDVMIGRDESTLDMTERWIRRFAEQNACYSVTWSHSYNEIEKQMAHVQYLVSIKEREKAAHVHETFLNREMVLDTIDSIPFRQEAELFSPFYWTNKARYEAAMKEVG